MKTKRAEQGLALPGSDGRERIYKHSSYKRKSVLFNLYFAPVWWYNVLYII